MANMGRYCKAYYVHQLTAFSGWKPDLQQLRPAESEGDDAAETPTVRTELRDDDILYVQETLAVTDGIFLDQHIVFDPRSAEWDAFCRGPLAFQIPADLDDTVAESEAAADEETAEHTA
jgi:hypothetical protein